MLIEKRKFDIRVWVLSLEGIAWKGKPLVRFSEGPFQVLVRRAGARPKGPVNPRLIHGASHNRRGLCVSMLRLGSAWDP